jgi:two-component system CheB/CheR fusion protein
MGKKSLKGRGTDRHRLGAVVGIGASAGGLEAFSAVLQRLPADTRMSFVFISHLDPKHESILTSLLARTTSMPVVEAKHGMVLEPDHVYVIPRNAMMVIDKRTLSLSRRLKAPAENLPIDHFLKSLARDRGQRAIGVILSGTASDGTIGMTAIKNGGGITIVQEPGSARYDGMPRSAIKGGAADFVLPPREIAVKLVQIARHPRPMAVAAPRSPDRATGGLAGVFARLRERTGVDFSAYKKATIQRRLHRQMTLVKMRSVKDYAELLRRNPAELETLYEELLIKVTEFFRDPEIFERLRTTILPSLLKEKPRKEPFRVWVPGCSTGEEAYSIAILLFEVMERRRLRHPIQIFATDLSERAIAVARAGVYPAGIARSVSAVRLRRFFVKSGESYTIGQRIREACTFARQDVTKDPPFSKVDLVSCRNVFIYMGKALQERVLSIFHYALRPDGCLLLGKAESLDGSSGLFVSVDTKHKVYRKRSARARQAPERSARPEEPDARPKVREAAKERTVLFEPTASSSPHGRRTRRSAGTTIAPGGIGDRREVVRLRKQLRLLSDSHQTAEEKLKAANEELVSSMEELQSANEELQTSQEELESTNEELTTVNDQVAVRNRDLTELSNDLTNLVTSVDVPIVMLTGDLRLRRSTPAADKVMGLTHADIGRHVTGIRHNLRFPDFADTAAEVLATLRAREIEVQDRSNVWYSMRLRPYRTEDNRIDGLVVVLFEIDRLKRSFQEVERSRNFSRTIVEAVREPLLVLGADRRVLMANDAFLKTFHTSRTALENRLVFELEPTGFRSAAFKRMLADALGRRLRHHDFEIEFAIDGSTPTIMAIDARHFDQLGDGAVVLLTMKDITRFRLAERRLVASRDIVQKGRTRAESSLRESRQELSVSRRELRVLAGRLIRAQEEERKRVARELHDDLSQRLSALQIGSAGLARLAPEGEQAKAGFVAHEEHLAEVVEGVRRLAYDLHPAILTHLGLRAALRSFCVNFSSREGIDVDFSAQKEPAALPEEIALCLYRVTQEGLRNVAKHSGAKSASVVLETKHGVMHLSIQDQGKGFDVGEGKKSEGLGLLGMKERVRLVDGTLRVSSRPGHGTRIEVRVPVAPLSD